MASSLLLPSAPTNVNVVLDGLESLAARMTDLKKETLEKETAVLEAIIKRVTPLIPLLSKTRCILVDAGLSSHMIELTRRLMGEHIFTVRAI